MRLPMHVHLEDDGAVLLAARGGHVVHVPVGVGSLGALDVVGHVEVLELHVLVLEVLLACVKSEGVKSEGGGGRKRGGGVATHST